MRRVFLGVDCGTQSTKVVLRDPATGAVVAVGRAPHELIERDDGTREQDPAWWIDALRSAVRDAVRGEQFDIGGIGVSGQQHGLVCLDRNDRPVRAAKLWNDTTTARECVALTDALGGESRVLELVGNLMLPGYTAPKIAWLAAREPDAYARTVRMCLPHDYLNLWLTAQFVTEFGDASGTAYFDIRARRYSDTVLAAIDNRRDWTRTLPPLARSLSVVGMLRREAAESLGLTAGIPVSAGGGDNMRAAIGYAVVEGVTFGLRYAMDALRRAGVAPTEVTLIGGGAASDAWAQLCADVFELPVVRPVIVEAAASGAARQAQWAVEGKRPDLATAPSRRFEPRPGRELHEAAERMATLREIAGANRI